jgi:hypothetical protein
VNTNDPRRKLTPLEEKIRDYLTEHSGITSYDVAEAFGQVFAVYSATTYLYLNNYIEHNSRTEALTPLQT